MDKHKYNDNDILFRQKFDNYEVDLPADDWDVFSRKLAEAQPKRRRFVWYYVAAAVSVAGVIFLGSSLLNKQNNPTEPIFAKQEVSQPKHPQKMLLANNVDATSTAKNNRIGTSVTTPKTSGQVNTVQSNQPETNNGVRTGKGEAIIATNAASSSSIIGSPSVPETVIAQKKTTTEQFDTTGYITHPVPHYAELPALQTDQSERDKKSNKNNRTGANNMVKWLAGTFQGNLSLSSGAGNNLTNDGSIGSQLFTRVSQAESLNGSSSSNLISFAGKKTYYVPLSFGLSFGMPLSKRWELQSGLVYTLLITTGELGAQYTGGNKSTGRIEQHYLGIPVSLSYSFICKPSFSVYLIGGSRIEKGISLVEKIYTYNAQDTPIEQERYHYSIKGVQLSLDAGVGASYRLYRFIHWYVETGGAWYVPCNQPESARTEHPLNVSFKTGLKFSLSKQ